jgi:hypothetical protein
MMKRLVLLALFSLAATPAWAQLSGPPAGGPTGQFLGPPSGNVANFLGVWTLTWDGPIASHCPCHGTLTISTNNNGELRGTWKTSGLPSTLSGPVGFNQNVWIGHFAQPDDVDFPQRGHFRLEYRDERTLTGSYQPDGTAVPFSWKGSRL